jgi:DNA-binding NarL/FixJ family response regulator
MLRATPKCVKVVYKEGATRVQIMRVALLWKDTLGREAITALLETRGRFDVVVATDQAKDCLEAVREHQAHIVLAESRLLDSSQRQFLFGAKMLGSFGLVFVTHPEDEDSDLADSTSNVSLSASADELFARMRENAGSIMETGYDRGRKKALKPHGLSPREYEVAQLVSKGYSNRRIAEETGMQEQSVKNLVSTIIRKLRCENRTQVALRVLI